MNGDITGGTFYTVINLSATDVSYIKLPAVWLLIEGAFGLQILVVLYWALIYMWV